MRCCPKLSTIYFSDNTYAYGENVFNGTPWYEKQANGVVYTGSVLYKIKGTLPKDCEIIVREGTKGIASFAFCSDYNGYYYEGDKNLKSVVIPDGVTNIGQLAFYNCTNLESVVLPDSITDMSVSVFCGCENLKSINIPSSLRRIEGAAFSGCSSLTEIIIPYNVNEIDSIAFCNCESLKKITIKNPSCNIYDGNDTICNDYYYEDGMAVFNGIIYGYDNSTAWEYAYKNGYTFASIGKEPIYVKGDVNVDGKVSIADAVMLQKWLLGNGTLIRWESADLCEDGEINAFDMVLMRKIIVN